MEAQSNLFQLKAEKFNNPNIWAVIHGDDPFNDVIRNAIQNYNSGQQQEITSLTHQVINDHIQQAQQMAQQAAQQGGSDGGSSTTAGVCTVNGN